MARSGGGGGLLNKKSLSHLERLGRIQNLEAQGRIQNLEAQGRIENIYPFCRRYNEVPISDHSGVIYCDPPYRNTTGYQRAHAPDPFNYEAFYDWCERQTVPVIISEYDMPKERFITIAEREKVVEMSSAATHYKATERLFIPNCQEKLYAARMNQPCPDTTTAPPVMPESKKESAPKREQLSLF